MDRRAELAVRYLNEHDRRVQPYQPAGDLNIHLPGHCSEQDYTRAIDIADGIVEVNYRIGDVTYTRQVFVSAQYQVVVARLSADRPGRITADLNLSRVDDPECEIAASSEANRSVLDGVFAEGIRFACETRAIAKGGEVSSGDGAMLHVNGADELLVLLSIAVDLHQPEPAGWCKSNLDRVPADFETLLTAHRDEHRSLFDRVTLELGRGPEAELLPMDKRLERVRAGGEDTGPGGVILPVRQVSFDVEFAKMRAAGQLAGDLERGASTAVGV